MKNCWRGWGFEPTIIDLDSQSGVFDLSATAIPFDGFSIRQAAWGNRLK